MLCTNNELEFLQIVYKKLEENGYNGVVKHCCSCEKLIENDSTYCIYCGVNQVKAKNVLIWKIGRHRNNQFVENNSIVSNNHCIIIYAGKKLYIQDLSSTNGTFVNNHKIPGVKPIAISRGHEIRLGPNMIKPDIMDTIQSEVKAAHNKQIQNNNIFLRWKIGRVGDNDFVVNQPGVSRHHCVVTYDGQVLNVYDLNTTNGTYVNKHKVPGMKRIKISPDEKIRLGKTHLIRPYIMEKIRSDIAKSEQNRKNIKDNDYNTYHNVVHIDDVWNVGRYSGNDYVVKAPMVSGHHCQIFKKENKWFIKDNKSTNKTIVDNKEIDPYTMIEINKNSTIKLGSHKFKFDFPKSNNTINKSQSLVNKYYHLKTINNKLLYSEDISMKYTSYRFLYMLYSDDFNNEEHEKKITGFYKNLCEEKQKMDKVVNRISIFVIIFFKKGFDDRTIKRIKSKSRRSKPYSLKFVPIDMTKQKQQINRFSTEDFSTAINLSFEQLSKKQKNDSQINLSHDQFPKNQEKKEDSSIIQTYYKQYFENFINYWIVFLTLILNPIELAIRIKKGKITTSGMNKFFLSSIAVHSVISGFINSFLNFLGKESSKLSILFSQKELIGNEIIKLIQLIPEDITLTLTYYIFVLMITFFLHCQFGIFGSVTKKSHTFYAMSYLFSSFLPVYSISISFVQVLSFFLTNFISYMLIIVLVIINAFFLYCAIPLLLHIYDDISANKIIIISLANIIIITFIVLFMSIVY